MADLQPLIHRLLCDTFPYTIIGSLPADGQPDERIQHRYADIGGVLLKTDSGGNTYGQCLKYYVGQVLALRENASPIFGHSCIPMLWLELSCATLRVCAAAFFDSHFVFEPLTPALHLYGINDPLHMLTLARCCNAVSQTLAQLARLYDSLALQKCLPAGLQHSSTSIPYHISKTYPDAQVRQLMYPRRLVFLVEPPTPSPPVIVKLVAGGADSPGPSEIHALWAHAGLAPKQVLSRLLLLTSCYGCLQFSLHLTVLFPGDRCTVPLCRTTCWLLKWSTCPSQTGRPWPSWHLSGCRGLQMMKLASPCRSKTGIQLQPSHEML